ncbi:hypothetical protein BV898_18125 [Hypsibius exemplaris]|uniref:Protein quiver n=1 Tax=Hypsibius exemplaris TaxID=2072580 RepID=A0A9X6RMU7_HYPEX|nr:hypothetical protein BV898_18125 [Hypsibius exemplaris]
MFSVCKLIAFVCVLIGVCSISGVISIRCYSCAEHLQPYCASNNQTLLEGYTKLCAQDQPWCLIAKPKNGPTTHFGLTRACAKNDGSNRLGHSVLQNVDLYFCDEDLCNDGRSSTDMGFFSGLIALVLSSWICINTSKY